MINSLEYVGHLFVLILLLGNIVHDVISTLIHVYPHT